MASRYTEVPAAIAARLDTNVVALTKVAAVDGPESLKFPENHSAYAFVWYENSDFNKVQYVAGQMTSIETLNLFVVIVAAKSSGNAKVAAVELLEDVLPWVLGFQPPITDQVPVWPIVPSTIDVYQVDEKRYGFIVSCSVDMQYQQEIPA